MRWLAESIHNRTCRHSGSLNANLISWRNDQAIELVRGQVKNQFHHLAVLRVSIKVQAADDDWRPNRGLKRSAQY
jgi:hypothetical protein